MSTKTTLPISEARRKIFEIAEEVQKPNMYYVFTEKGRPKAVMMSAEEFESWQETMEVMREFPNLDKDIAEAERDLKKGNYITLDELLEEQGYITPSRSKNKYAISGNRSIKGSKRPRKNR